MPTPHAQLIHDVRLALGREIDVLLWPNVNAVLESDGRKMRTGMTPGASDLVGVGPGGCFLAIEVKAGHDNVKPHQQRFIDLVEKRGGTAGVARSVEDAWSIVRRAREKDRGE